MTSSTSATTSKAPQLFLDDARKLRIFEQHPSMHISRLATSADQFAGVLLDELPKHYGEVDTSFTLSLLKTADQTRDPHGYFTQAKRIFWLTLQDEPIGFTVVSMKRGGSVKIGPTGIVKTHRRQGLATLLRDVVEAHLEQVLDCRKLYVTIATTNLPALLFNLGRGYRVEAMLRSQYRDGIDEIVLGRFRDEARMTPSVKSQSASSSAALSPVRASRIASPTTSLVRSLLEERMHGLYDEIDPSYFAAIADACAPPRQSYPLKGKQLFVVRRGDAVTGVTVYVPKRGGASKLSPLMVDDENSAGELLSSVERYALETGRRKLYAHIPLAGLSSVRWLFERGYILEGVLREPYRKNVDLAVIGKCLV